MSEIRSGLRHALANPWLYNTSQHAVGAYRWRRRVIRELLLPHLGDDGAVVDIGCGTGEILHYLPDHIRYVGFDRNPDYIEEAKRSFAARNAVFRCEELTPQYEANGDLVDHALAFGLLHHLDDAAARSLFRAAKRLLKPKGSLLTLDPVYTDAQSWLARYVVSKDRGTEVRTEAAYRRLALEEFDHVEIFLDSSPLRIPYTGIVMRCS